MPAAMTGTRRSCWPRRAISLNSDVSPVRCTLIFQPAEEIGAGARKMISDGLFERFPVDAVFGLHNWPGVPLGQFGFVADAAMASVDQAVIRIVGKGGHGAEPHQAVDPVLASAAFITALQSVVSRNVDPQDMAVVTVGSIHGGSASNVIPESVELKLTMRAFSETVRQQLQARIPALARAQAESFGAKADVNYRLGFPALINHHDETAFARAVALETFGAATDRAGFPASHGKRGFRLHAAGASRAAISSSAMATAPLCTAPTTISTTRSSRRPPATGCGWPRPSFHE